MGLFWHQTCIRGSWRDLHVQPLSWRLGLLACTARSFYWLQRDWKWYRGESGCNAVVFMPDPKELSFLRGKGQSAPLQCWGIRKNEHMGFPAVGVLHWGGVSFTRVRGQQVTYRHRELYSRGFLLTRTVLHLLLFTQKTPNTKQICKCN